jgi:hypothetical protein
MTTKRKATKGKPVPGVPRKLVLHPSHKLGTDSHTTCAVCCRVGSDLVPPCPGYVTASEAHSHTPNPKRRRK